MVNDYDPVDTVGGTERYISHLSQALENVGHDVHLFALGKEGACEARREVLVVADIEPTWRHVCHVFFYRRLYLALRASVLRLRPDVVHLHNNNRFVLTVLLATRGCRVVQTVHDYCGLYPTAFCARVPSCATGSIFDGIRHGCMNWKLALTEGWLLYNRPLVDRLFVDHFIAPSRDLGDHLKSAGHRQVTYLPNLIDVVAHGSADMPPARERLVLYVGSLVEHKGIDVLLHAHRLVQDLFPDATLWVVGTGPDEDRLRRLSNSLTLRNVTFWGHQTVSELGRCYRRASVVVIPSLWLENAPLVAYEAMAYGRALLVTNTAGLAELVLPGKTGFVFERGDSAELAQRLGDILADPVIAAKFGDAGREFWDAFGGAAEHAGRLTVVYEGRDG